MSHRFEQTSEGDLFNLVDATSAQTEVDGKANHPMMTAPAELRVGVLGFAAENDDHDLYYRQVEVRRLNHSSTKSTVMRGSGRHKWSGAAVDVRHNTNIPYIGHIVQDAFAPPATLEVGKPQTSLSCANLVGKTVTVTTGVHEGIVGVVTALDTSGALIIPYTKHEKVMAPTSTLAIGGVILSLNVPITFYVNKQFKSEALPDYVRERTLTIDHHGQIEIILKWLKQFDQGKNIRRLRLVNLVHLVCRNRGAQDSEQEVLMKEELMKKHSNKEVEPPLPKTRIPMSAPYHDMDGHLTYNEQQPGEYGHFDLINACPHLSKLELDLDFSAFWEEPETDMLSLAPIPAPFLRTVEQIVQQYGLDTFLRIPGLRVLHVRGLVYEESAYIHSRCDDFGEEALVQIRGELTKWLQENKPKGLVVKVFTSPWGDEGMGEEEEAEGLTW